MSEQTYLVRLSGEISTKAPKTRNRFTQRLAANLADALDSEGLQHRVEATWSRLYVHVADDSEGRAGEAIGRVYGVQSYSPVTVRPWGSLDDLVATGTELFADAVRGRSFAVRARRTGAGERPADVGTVELERALGTALLEHAREVDLTEPEARVFVEMAPRDAYFFTAKNPGQGGLALGLEGRALALLSGGFDSAVAAWAVARRGLAVDHLFLNLAGPSAEREARAVSDVLARRWSHGDRPKLHVVDFRPVVAELKARVRARYWQVVLKRLMLRVGEAVAGEERHLALVTGESLGQVSSQTPRNLASVAVPIEIPVFRPLLGWNKEEILERARALGTYELSAGVKEHCALQPRRPATHASRGPIDRGEEAVGSELLEHAVTERRVIDLRSPDAARPPAVAADLELERVPEGARVVDLRSRHGYEAWRYPGAVHLDFLEALARWRELDRSATWVLYCEEGLKSAHLAELMREAGFAAHHLGGRAFELARRAQGDDPLLGTLLAPAVRD